MKNILICVAATWIFLAVDPDAVTAEIHTADIAEGDTTRGEDLTAEDQECTWLFTDPCSGTKSCYHLVEGTLDFSSAEQHCISYHDGHIAAPSTPCENFFLRTRLLEAYGGDQTLEHRVWTGAFFWNGIWAFTSADPFIFTDWEPGQPSQDEYICSTFRGLIDSNYYFQWAAYPCNYRFNFLCES